MAKHTEFICPKCGAVNCRPRDVEHGWCTRCQDWTENHLSVSREKVAR